MAAGLDTLVAGDALVRAVLVLAALVAARWLLGAALRGASHVPGRLGVLARGLARGVRPGVARRLLAAVVGLGVPAVAAVAELPTAAAAGLDHRAGDVVGRPVLPPPATSRPGAQARPDASSEVVVRPGDTLWDIARRHLPRAASPTAIAAAWPRWYAANRAAIGPDPALLRPGTRLRSPDRRPAGTPASSHDRPPVPRTDAGAVARSLDPDRR